MGMITRGALSTMVAADNYLLMDIPDCWTMEQSASVPVVYGTVIHALRKVKFFSISGNIRINNLFAGWQN